MAYCKKCGAYIPDGLTACLACGFDENLKAGETAAQTKSASDLLGRRRTAAGPSRSRSAAASRIRAGSGRRRSLPAARPNGRTPPATTPTAAR